MAADRVGQQIGPYRLSRLLGTGGFGEVYEAEHLLLQQRRAIKLLLERHLHAPTQRERFLREARTLAALDHPNILPVLELGEEGNLFYLVMPYYRRGTLADLLKERGMQLSLEEIEGFLTQICTALGYAHVQGIVHLDLKPENLLLHEEGRLVLADFGLAHLIKQGRLEAGSSASWGTPYYMAPEHIRGEPEQRSDLYALGILLYQLLTGQHPFRGPTPEAVMMKHLLEPPPSLRAARPGEPLAAFEPIIKKALAKPPAARYQTASDLLVAYRVAVENQRPRPVSPPHLPVQVPIQANKAPSKKVPLPSTNIAAFQQNQDAPQLILKGHTDAVNAAAWSPNGHRLASASHDGTVRLWDTASGQSHAMLSGHTDAVNAVAWSPDGRRLTSASHDETMRLWDVTNWKLLATVSGHTDAVNAVAWSPDGHRLASASRDGTVRLWDAASGQFQTTLSSHARWVYAVAWSPDGRRLASASGDGTVRLWDAISGQSLATLSGHTDRVYDVAWSPDGRWLASANRDKTVRVWDAISGQSLVTLSGHTDRVNGIVWSPDGRQLASASSDKTVRLWDATSGQSLSILSSHTSWVNTVAWSPDGRRLASASSDGTVHLWWIGQR